MSVKASIYQPFSVFSLTLGTRATWLGSGDVNGLRRRFVCRRSALSVAACSVKTNEREIITGLELYIVC